MDMVDVADQELHAVVLSAFSQSTIHPSSIYRLSAVFLLLHSASFHFALPSALQNKEMEVVKVEWEALKKVAMLLVPCLT